MGDGPSRKSGLVSDLKIEWSLFWQGLLSNEEDDKKTEAEALRKLEADDILPELQKMDADKIKLMVQKISQERKKLNQSIEKIKKEIEFTTSRIETAKLVGGGSEDESMERIHELTEEGAELSSLLMDVDEKIKTIRQFQKKSKAEASR